MLLSNWDIPSGPGSSFWFRGISGLDSRRSTKLGAQVLQAALLGLCDFIALVHKVGPRPPALVGSGNQTDVKAASPRQPPGL